MTALIFWVSIDLIVNKTQSNHIIVGLLTLGNLYQMNIRSVKITTTLLSRDIS